jgi:hypothetical protein
MAKVGVGEPNDIGYQPPAVLSIERFYGRVTTWVGNTGNTMEETLCMFNEITGMEILVPIMRRK